MRRRRFEHRVRRDLHAAVETAVPRGTWDDVVARLDRPSTPPPMEDVIMLDTPTRETEADAAESDPPNRRVLVGALSVVLLAAVIGVAVLAGRNDDGPAPADDSSPVATAEAVVVAFTSGDTDAFMAFFADDALAVNSAFFRDLPIGQLDNPSTRAAFEGSVEAAAVGWEREPLIDSTCREEGDRVVCDLTYEGAITGEPELQTLELRIEDGVVTSFRQRSTSVDPDAVEAFLGWLGQLDPTPEGQACVEIDFASTACGELWYEFVDQYLAEQDAG